MADQDKPTTENSNDETLKEDATQVAPESQIEETAPDAEAKSVNFDVGDRVVVTYRISEGEKSRLQPFEGIVIGIKNAGVSKTFTVRRIGAGNVGVERIFPVFSPNIESVDIKSKGKVRRAKLYYLRDRIGRAASKVKERTKTKVATVEVKSS